MEKLFTPVSRRGFFKLAAIGSGTMLALTVLPKAMAADLISADGAQALKSTISRNHGHSFRATLEEVLAAGPKTYDIQGGSRHPHSLELTQEILDLLKAGKTVDVDSSEDAGHAHVVRLEIV